MNYLLFLRKKYSIYLLVFLFIVSFLKVNILSEDDVPFPEVLPAETSGEKEEVESESSESTAVESAEEPVTGTDTKKEEVKVEKKADNSAGNTEKTKKNSSKIENR